MNYEVFKLQFFNFCNATRNLHIGGPGGGAGGRHVQCFLPNTYAVCLKSLFEKN